MTVDERLAAVERKLSKCNELLAHIEDRWQQGLGEPGVHEERQRLVNVSLGAVERVRAQLEWARAVVGEPTLRAPRDYPLNADPS